MKWLWCSIAILMAAAAPALSQQKYYVDLAGFNQVPEVRTPAMGQLQVWVEEDSLHVSGEFENLKDTYLAGYIHYGKKGKQGNRIYQLRVEIGENYTSGTYDPQKNRFHLNDAMREALREGNLYINISSRQHQHGEIRGQIPPIP
ncbi:MAG: CHRD domain-containing protein [Bacteroidetes bacterium]|jgi:hypothetical protein|nr:CHRD domain-containing protein [Bacteroidota bacterium]